MKNGPIKSENGVIRYYKDDVLHKEDGPAIIYPNEYEEWVIDGKTSRKDGPAIIYADGYKEWVVDGVTHRVDGPAVVRSDGTEAYYLYGTMYSKEEYYKILPTIGLEEHKKKIDGI